MFKKSVILPAFFPDSMDYEKAFLNAITAIKKYDIEVVEFFYKGKEKEAIKEILSSHKIESIYLGAMSAKQNNLNLSSLNTEVRTESVQRIKECVDDAYFYNSQSILINSGRRPHNEVDNNKAYQYFKRSIIGLLDYIDRKSKDYHYKLKLTLEPGDTDVDSFSLIGHTDLAIKLIQELREIYENVSLTMDTSHLIQLDEDPIESIEKALPYCNHIHLANCIIRDKLHELYGDKHPEFGIEGGEISINKAKHITGEIKKLYRKDNLILGLEVIYRAVKKDRENEFDSFDDTVRTFID